MRVLVTGGLGHIGSKLIREYISRDDVELIRIFDNLSTQRYCSLFNLPSENFEKTIKSKFSDENFDEISSRTKVLDTFKIKDFEVFGNNNDAKFSLKKCEFVEGDIMNIELLKKSMKDIDIVIHLASITDAPSTINNSELTEKIIYNGTWNVLNSAVHANVKKFLHASTTSVYGEAEGIVDENYNNYKPASPYAEAKRKTEILIQNVSKEIDFPSIILRKGTIFGTSIGMRFHTAINKFCYLAVMGKPLTVWDSALNSKRPYLGLNDCINAYKFFESNGGNGEIYNVVTKNFEMKEIIECIKKILPEVKVEITKSPLLNQKPYNVSDEKIKKIGFRYEDDLERNMKETIELFKGINN